MQIKCDTKNEKEGNNIKLRKQLEQTVKGKDGIRLHSFLWQLLVVEMLVYTFRIALFYFSIRK